MGAPEPNLRPAREGDRERLRTWRNDPGTVAASNGRTVEPAEHAAWFEAKLADADSRLWIIEYEGSPVGQVRMDRRPRGEAELHIALAADAQGKGIGPAAIEAALRELPASWQTAAVVARVQYGNRASLAAFAKAGFVESSADQRAVTLRRVP